MKKRAPIVTVILLSLVFVLLAIPAHADDGKIIDWSQYDLDELLQIQEELAEEIYQRKIEFAKENGDRLIQLSDSSINLFTGKTYTPEITIERVLDDSPEKTTLVWTSSDENIATVDNNGRITGKALGKVTVTCCAEDDEFIRNTIEVNVVLPVTKLTLPATEELVMSEKDTEPVTLQLECLIEPEEAFDKTIIWTSDNEEVVTVDEKGVLTAIGPGKAKITASSSDGYSDRPVTAACSVTVSMQVSSIELEEENLIIEKNKTQTINYTVYPENASQPGVQWESSDPETVAVNTRGQITAKACGTATITCSSTDGSEVFNEIQITVIQKVTGLRWEDNTPITLNVGRTFTPKVVVSPEDATDKGLKWESSDINVVIVASDGKISATGPGTAKITCTAVDGSEKAITRDVFVPSIGVNTKEYTVTQKGGMQISFDYFGKYEDLSWRVSSDAYCDSSMSINTGTQSGTIKLTPKKAGTFTITIEDKNSPKSRVSIKVTVAHSAAYDTVSYPKANYTDILRNPSYYKGDQVSIYGKVLQKQSSWGTTVLRVGTGGYGYYDSVFYITYDSSKIDLNVIEDDYITIYGKCTGTKTYTTVMGASITIPSIEAERIMLGRN